MLVPQEVDELFVTLRELTAEGATVIFISHKLDEVLSVADAITVIRAGRTVAEIADVGSVTAHQLAELMVGSELPTPETRVSTVTDVVALEVDGLTVVDDDGREVLRRRLASPSTGVRSSGIAGVEGNGQTELIRALVGVMPIVAGRITMEGDDITHRGHARAGAIARHRLHPGGPPVRRSRALGAAVGERGVRPPGPSAPWHAGRGSTATAARRRTESRSIDEYDVRTPGPDVAALALSGGNQQKLIVGREMTAGPKVLIAAHPTRGIDVGAQAAVWEEIKKARMAGLATLLDLGRPRRADRAVRHAPRDAARPHRVEARPDQGDCRPSSGPT